MMGTPWNASYRIMIPDALGKSSVWDPYGHIPRPPIVRQSLPHPHPTNRARSPPRSLRSPVALTFTNSRSVVPFANLFSIHSTLFPVLILHDNMRFFSVAILPFSLAVLASAGPIVNKRASFTLQNGKDAQALNAKFASLSAGSSCTSGEVACVQGAFAQCVNGQFISTPCAGGLTCVALPLVNSPGTR